MEEQETSAKVEIYTLRSCPYCVRAKMLLHSKEISYIEHAVEHDEGRQKMRERSHGHDTFPQIFINDRHVGGCYELFSLEREGRLDNLLAGEIDSLLG